MPRAYYCNQYYQSNADFFYQIRVRLVAAGWTVPQDSDGTTYSSSGAQINNANQQVTRSLWNANAWYRLRHPSSTCEYIVQKGATNPTTSESWKLYFSFAGFSGGAPNATTPPTATDQIQVCGNGGADASFGETDQDFRTDLFIGGSDESYSFYAQQRPMAYGAGETQRGNTVKAYWGFEKVLSPDSSDASPYLCLISTTDGWGNSFDLFDGASLVWRPDQTTTPDFNGTRGAIGRYRSGSEGDEWVVYSLMTPAARSGGSATLQITSGGTASSVSARAFAVPLYWMRGSTVVTDTSSTSLGKPGQNVKGRSRFLQYLSTKVINGGFLLPQKRFALFTSVIMPWDGTSEIR